MTDFKEQQLVALRNLYSEWVSTLDENYRKVMHTDHYIPNQQLSKVLDETNGFWAWVKKTQPPDAYDEKLCEYTKEIWSKYDGATISTDVLHPLYPEFLTEEYKSKKRKYCVGHYTRYRIAEEFRTWCETKYPKQYQLVNIFDIFNDEEGNSFEAHPIYEKDEVEEERIKKKQKRSQEEEEEEEEEDSDEDDDSDNDDEDSDEDEDEEEEEEDSGEEEDQ